MSDVPLAGWLAENNLSAYLTAFEEDGYDVQVLSKLNEEELSEVMDDVKMKKGHRRKLPLALEQVREHDANNQAAERAAAQAEADLQAELRALEAKEKVAAKEAAILKLSAVDAKEETQGCVLPPRTKYRKWRTPISSC
jgi:hypothetical protein